MSNEKIIIDISADPSLINSIQSLVSTHSEIAKISEFRSTTNAGNASKFSIDPGTIEILKDATIILQAGSAALVFLTQLRVLVTDSKEKIKAKYRKDGKKI